MTFYVLMALAVVNCILNAIGITLPGFTAVYWGIVTLYWWSASKREEARQITSDRIVEDYKTKVLPDVNAIRKDQAIARDRIDKVMKTINEMNGYNN